MPLHLPQERIIELAANINDLVGYDQSIRAVSIGGLPRKFTGLLPGNPNCPELVSLTLDLQYLNSVDRLSDGAVPLKIFLQNLEAITAPLGSTEKLREALDDIAAGTTGSPRVAVDHLPETKEKIIFQDDMVSYAFMAAGVAAARAVAKLSVPRFDGGVPRMLQANPMIYLGTGWLLGAGLLITNHHVVNARNEGEAPATESDLRKQVAGTIALFDYDIAETAGSSKTPIELAAWNATLDYAVVRIADDKRVPLLPAPQAINEVKAGENFAVNIIQHPDGKPKRYAIRNNLVTAASATDLRYFTDTLGGSSGSPVLNDLWQVLALHRGSSFVKGVRFQGRDVAYVNVGTQISAIITDLRARFAGKLPELGI